MKRQNPRIALLACLMIVSLMATAIEAASPVRATTITVKMENENCAKRIATGLREVPNVAEVRTDVKKQVATVIPAGMRSPSPRALWEAAENTGHAVSQLQGPHGTFTSKPEN
jgi:copper chaperone CopZ